MPKAFSEHEKGLIGKRLLEQGYRQFSAYGLRKTSIEEIAKAAGISKGAFYNFYESKESLFMAVAEWAEARYRREILTAIDLPGPSPRARLLTIFKKAFALLDTMPVLQFITGSDYDLLFRRLPPETLERHLAGDQAFFEELVTRCRKAGIPIRARPEEVSSLLYPLVLAILHKDDLGRDRLSGSIESLLELIAAFSLGEVKIRLQKQSRPASVSQKASSYEPGD